MKILVSPSSYEFSASSGTITFTSEIPSNQGSILNVTNVSRGALLYQPQAGADYAGTWATPVLTLNASTDGMSDSDYLEVFVDNGVVPATLTAQTTGNSTLVTISNKLPTLLNNRVPVDVGDLVVNIGSNLEIANDIGNPVPIVHVGSPLVVTDGGATLSIDDGNSSITVDGNVNINGTVPVSGPLTNDQLRASALPVSFSTAPLATGASTSANQVIANNLLTEISTKISGLRVPTTTSIASSASSVTLLSANSNRKGLSICNLSTSILYLSYSSPATLANCFIKLLPDTFILLDQQLIVGNAIYGFWSSVNGSAQVTEYV